MCNPPRKNIVQKVVHHVNELKLKALYVATDNDPMIEEFKEAFKSLKVLNHSIVCVIYIITFFYTGWFMLLCLVVL